MKTFVLCVVAVIFTTTQVSSTNAQSLAKRHQVGLKLGIWNQVTDVRTEIQRGFATTSVKSSGGMGGLFYGHWFSENQALIVSVGSMVANIETVVNMAGTTSETAVVAPVLIGMKYYFLQSSLDSPVRPQATASVGTFIGSQTRQQVGSTIVSDTRAEMVFGGQLGLGADFLLSRRFMLGTAIAYNVMQDFEEPIGGSRNYGGPEFSLSFSYLFGKIRHQPATEE